MNGEKQAHITGNRTGNNHANNKINSNNNNTNYNTNRVTNSYRTTYIFNLCPGASIPPPPPAVRGILPTSTELLDASQIGYRTKGGRRELPALHYAAEVGDEAEVYRILMGWSVESSTSKHMRDVGENDKQRGMNPLHYAAKRGDEGIVLLILSYQKARFNFYSRTWQKGKRPPKNVPEATPPAKPENAFKSLLASKSSGHGMDALHYAAACGHDGVANILLKYGADIKTECVWAGKNSMHYAAALGHVKVLSRLKSYLDSQEGVTDKPNPSKRNGGGKRELVQTTHGQISPSPALEENSANSVSDTQQDGWSIVRSKKGGGRRHSKPKVEDNLERKVTFKEVLETKSRRDGMTPLHFAASKGRDTAAKFLIECGASIEARCASSGMEPIHYAAKHGCFTTTRLLYVIMPILMLSVERREWLLYTMPPRWGTKLW